MEKFKYDGPYVFQSEKHQGKLLEDLFFTEIGFVLWLKSKKNTLHFSLWQHLEFLFDASKKLETKMICPVCKKNTVKIFYLTAKGINKKYVSCKNESCRQAIKGTYHVEYDLPISFEALERLRTKEMKDSAGRLFKEIFGLPTRLKEDTTFNMFKKTCSKSQSPAKSRPRLFDGRQLSLVF